MICNPYQAFMSQQANAQANPFEAWQKLWLQGMSAMQPQAPASLPVPPADMFSQLSTMQNMWMNMFMPQQVQAGQQAAPAMQAPKITVTTIELGDMRPYLQMASQMLSAWQPMLNVMGGGRR